MKHRKYLLKTCVLLFLFVCASAAPSVFAQDGPPESQKIGVGIRADGFVAAVDFNVRFWTESKFGFEAGYGQRYGWKEVPISALYTLAHINTDSVYIRPYVGGGISINSIPSGYSCSGDWETGDISCGISSATKIGGQGFGGVEFTFTAVPRLSLGVDVGHWRVPSGYKGLSFSETGIKFNVHYYLK